ncbi:hypothetical protein B1H18_27715 [Streptomyces tsukubensis]|uniref:Uncharacterized protein n=1 Tax=Streptomyces tsukubensis TaxID=83656 RepID=A0A1V4A2R7_9ACTN|nr:hypothetical protein B1H18_27715 [Streptomyces tsukubensis]
MSRPAARPGIAGLSPRYRVAAALALAFVSVVACFHIAAVFLHVAPANTVSKRHSGVLNDWIYPEFEQNWKLFAPNPLQQNVAVQARARVRTVDGAFRTTGWYDLSAMDGADIEGSLLPSHTQQNELRRAWDFYTASHDVREHPKGARGDLSGRYIHRIALMRVDRALPERARATVEEIQVRSRTTVVRPPPWSDEKTEGSPVYRQLSWWTVRPGDMPLPGRARTAKAAGAGAGTE